MFKTHLDMLFDLDDFETHIAAKYVRVAEHEGLSIANYTAKAQYDRQWSRVTKKCRGLIFETDTGFVIARGFDKFFNWDESGQPYPPTGPFILSDKFDGSLGIMYVTLGGEISVATRGSLNGDIAQHATQRAREIIDLYDIDVNAIKMLSSLGYTPLFEIIYPGNRVVVNYGDQDFLVLLDVINNRTGESNISKFDDFEWPWKATKTVVPAFTHSLVDNILEGNEGFVLYWPGKNFRCKMKSAEYVALHRIVTNISKKTVWEFLGSNKSLDELREMVPDELYPWLDQTVAELYDAAADQLDYIQNIYDGSPGPNASRKDFAFYAMNYPDVRKYLWVLYDGSTRENLFYMVWANMKPTGDTRPFAINEDVG